MRSRTTITAGLTALAVHAVLLASIAAAASLTVQSKEGLGSYLADDKGMTLYRFTKDGPDRSACGAANDCLKKWPLFLADTTEQGPGVDPAAAGVMTREDGARQSTYKGQPLYYFFKDKAGGDTNGQGVNGVWFVVAP